MTTSAMSGATIDNDWQRVTDNKGQRVVQQMTSTGASGKRLTPSDNEWQRVTRNDNEWQQLTKGGTTSKNGTVYFKELMIAILSITKIDTLLQGTNDWY